MVEILVDEEGYKQYYDKLENLKKSCLANANTLSQSCKDAVGDGWHDNPAYEEAMRISRMIDDDIQKMLDNQKYLKIVKKGNFDKNMVDIGDVLNVKMIYSDNEEEVETIKLTGKYIPNFDFNEISLNSPLGQAIYKKKIGEMCSYSVNGATISVIILKKINISNE